MFLNILDEHRREILPFFQSFRGRFYLAGGTALALQIGHRDSIDFDFFCSEEFDTQKLFEECRDIFSDLSIQKVQEEQNALTLIVDQKIKLSFFAYPYPLVGELQRTDFFDLASLKDIACMKLSAIVGRATQKDYVDLYFLLQEFSLDELLEAAERKFPDLERTLILKSLVYFEDIPEGPLFLKNPHSPLFAEMCTFLEKVVQKTTQQHFLKK